MLFAALLCCVKAQSCIVFIINIVFVFFFLDVLLYFFLIDICLICLLYKEKIKWKLFCSCVVNYSLTSLYSIANSLRKFFFLSLATITWCFLRKQAIFSLYLAAKKKLHLFYHTLSIYLSGFKYKPRLIANVVQAYVYVVVALEVCAGEQKKRVCFRQNFS